MRTQAKSSPKRTGVLGILNGGLRIRSGRQYMLAKVGLGLLGGGVFGLKMQAFKRRNCEGTRS